MHVQVFFVLKTPFRDPLPGKVKPSRQVMLTGEKAIQLFQILNPPVIRSIVPPSSADNRLESGGSVDKERIPHTK